jgi:hypothetical protein
MIMKSSEGVKPAASWDAIVVANTFGTCSWDANTVNTSSRAIVANRAMLETLRRRNVCPTMSACHS